MCSNYQAVSRSDRMLTFFGIERARDEDPIDVWPTGLAPFIRLAEPGSGNKLVVKDGLFGLPPPTQTAPLHSRHQNSFEEAETDV